jgi:hypothetical protein
MQTWLNYLPRACLDEKLSTIQMRQGEADTTQCFSQSQNVLHKQIITFPLELWVLLLLQNKYYITCLCVWLQLHGPHCRLGS